MEGRRREVKVVGGSDRRRGWHSHFIRGEPLIHQGCLSGVAQGSQKKSERAWWMTNDERDFSIVCRARHAAGCKVELGDKAAGWTGTAAAAAKHAANKNPDIRRILPLHFSHTAYSCVLRKDTSVNFCHSTRPMSRTPG